MFKVHLDVKPKTYSILNPSINRIVPCQKHTIEWVLHRLHRLHFMFSSKLAVNEGVHLLQLI